MDGLARFSEEAEAYMLWLLHGKETGVEMARNALLRLSRLIAIAMELPQSESAGGSEILPPVSDVEKAAAIGGAKRAPLDYYYEVFDCLGDLYPQQNAAAENSAVGGGQAPAKVNDHPVIGSLGDDLVSVYCEVAEGMQAYCSGKREDALWHWRFGFAHHWGEHATGAIRALYAWISAHSHNADY